MGAHLGEEELNRLQRFTERLAHALALVGFTGLLILAIMVVVDITLRRLFDYPLQGVNDVAAVVMAVVVSACIPNSLLARQNISVDVLGTILGGKAHLAINLFASLAVLLFFALMTWQFIPYAASITARGEQTWVLKWPVGPWWWVATIFFVVAVVAQAMVALVDLRRLMGWENGNAPSHEQGN
ncbi:MAG: TRAP transporter small permease subunit [Pseudomonadota bacterium]